VGGGGQPVNIDGIYSDLVEDTPEVRREDTSEPARESVREDTQEPVREGVELAGIAEVETAEAPRLSPVSNAVDRIPEAVQRIQFGTPGPTSVIASRETEPSNLDSPVTGISHPTNPDLSELTLLNQFPNDAKLVYIGPSGGSNPGGRYVNPASGRVYFAKDLGTIDRVDNEKEALRWLQEFTQSDAVSPLLGIDSSRKPNLIITRDVSKDTIPFNPNNPEHVELAKQDFVVNAFLANWDVFGLDFDNVRVDPTQKKLVYIDAGGALKYRAQGKLKGLQFGAAVNEIKSLRDSSINPQAAKVYSTLTEAEIKQQVENLLNYLLTTQLLKQSNNQLVLVKRAKWLAKQYGLQTLGDVINASLVEDKIKSTPNTKESAAYISSLITEGEMFALYNEKMSYAYSQTQDLLTALLQDQHVKQLISNPAYDTWKVGNKVWWSQEQEKLVVLDAAFSEQPMSELAKNGLLPPILFHGTQQTDNTSIDLTTGVYHPIKGS
jgi:hypothetical protein